MGCQRDKLKRKPQKTAKYQCKRCGVLAVKKKRLCKPKKVKQ